ncbi:delta-type opioid receptor-like [Physella acuta]|uniref:delta-type opioid receptor-like n=1 Tax=Physella acuta TaxID=109671 RepID=UPI0027DCC3AF|nr:delta-type opioid receptor-like [Physella acuta]
MADDEMNTEDAASTQGMIQPNLNIVTATENVNTLLTTIIPCSANIKNAQNFTSDTDCLLDTANTSSVAELVPQNISTTFSFLDMTNSTKMSTTGRQRGSLGAFSYEVEIANYLYVFVIPVIFCLSLLGNVISCMVFVRSGLDKPSNIITLGLAIADICAIQINIAKYFYVFGPGVSLLLPGWIVPRNVGYAAFIGFIGIEFIQNMGSNCVSFVTVVITFERCLAVFCPLRFSTIVTAPRAKAMVIFVFLFWLPWSLCTCFVYTFQYYYTETYKQFIARIYYSDWFLENKIIFDLFSYEIMSALSTIIPLILVTLGCIFIGIKIRLTNRKRKVLSSSSKSVSSSRTTRTLLSVCFVFVVIHSSIYLIGLVSSQLYAVNGVQGSGFYLILQVPVINILSSANSLMNVIIYLFLNPRFKDIFLDLIRLRFSLI